MTVVASTSRAEACPHAVSELEWQVLGRTNSIQRVDREFGAVWSSAGPLTSKEIKRLVNADRPNIGDAAINDHVHILYINRLIARLRDKSYVRVL